MVVFLLDGIAVHLVHDASVHKHHAGPAELLHVWLQQHTTRDDPSRQVVVHDGDLREKTVREAAEVSQSQLSLNHS